MVDNPLNVWMAPYVLYTVLFPGGRTTRVFMEEVPSFIQLHLVELADEAEVHHGPDSLALDDFRVTTLLVHCLEGTECRAHDGAYDQGWLLLIEKLSRLQAALQDVEVPRFTSLLVHGDVQGGCWDDPQ